MKNDIKEFDSEEEKELYIGFLREDYKRKTHIFRNTLKDCKSIFIRKREYTDWEFEASPLSEWFPLFQTSIVGIALMIIFGGFATADAMINWFASLFCCALCDSIIVWGSNGKYRGFPELLFAILSLPVVFAMNICKRVTSKKKIELVRNIRVDNERLEIKSISSSTLAYTIDKTIDGDIYHTSKTINRIERFRDEISSIHDEDKHNDCFMKLYLICDLLDRVKNLSESSKEAAYAFIKTQLDLLRMTVDYAFEQQHEQERPKTNQKDMVKVKLEPHVSKNPSIAGHH